MEVNIPETSPSGQSARIKKKPVICKIIAYSALTYFSILAILFLAGSVFSGKVIQVISSYYGPEKYPPALFRWFALSGAALYLLTASGVILFILNKKVGFYIFFIAALIIFSLDFAFLPFDWLRYLILSGFIFLLGIAHFSRRCYRS